MSDRSPIEWTDATWNPVRGCTKVSPGCKFCYAETLEQPMHWRRHRKIHVVRNNRPWIVIVEPDNDASLLVVVTVYEVSE